jgi:hypothetical protein
MICQTLCWIQPEEVLLRLLSAYWLVPGQKMIARLSRSVVERTARFTESG